MTPSAMNSILMRKSGFVSFVVASASRRIVPVTALIQNATHSIGRNFSSGDSGKAGANPRIRRSSATTTPTRTAIP